MDMEECILGWRGVNRQPAEPINMGLGLPRTMMDGEVSRTPPALQTSDEGVPTQSSSSLAIGVRNGL